MKQWLTRIGVQLGVTFVALALLFTLGAPILDNLHVSERVQKAIITIGLAGVAYAVTPDYEVDGVADDVQVQTAMNALPVTGGRLVLFAGNYVFAATVTRAINNITIEGDGKGTYLANDGVTALFSAGAQTGWVFREIRTDAGGITAASDTLFSGVWIGTSPRDSSVLTGTTMPTTATAVVGQQFYQNTTGRDVLYTYNGTAWKPVQAFGTLTVYVDSTDGTDDLDHGTGADAAAFKTIQYAVDFIPPQHEKAVVYINNESYAEDVRLEGKGTTGSGTVGGQVLELRGTLTTTATGLTATGGTQGAGAVQPNVTDAGLVANAYDNQILKFTSGVNNGLYRIVDNNTATQINLAGPALTGAPGAGDTYDIYNWGTTIRSLAAVRFLPDIYAYDLKFTNDVAGTESAVGMCTSTMYGYRLAVATNGTSLWGFLATTSGYIELWQSLVNNTGGAFSFGGGSTLNGTFNFEGSKMLGAGSANTAIYGNMAGMIYLRCSVLDGFDNGGQVFSNAALTCEGGTNTVIRNYSGYGMYAHRGGQIGGTSVNSYGGGGIANELGEAATYGYVD